MDIFGSFALVLAFVCAVYAFGGGIAAIVTGHPLLVKSTRQAGIATCCLIFLATFGLEYLFFSDNFANAYVVSHSNRDLATFYKIAALWSGQEGSLLFWSFLLSVYVFSVLITYRNKNGELMPYVGVVMAGVQIFFLTLNNFVASPFKVLASPGADGAMHYVARTDGNGLTPLLQYPEMVIHPPNLYSGYTGFTIPFAFALGALLARYPGEKWIHLTRKWTMIAWMFQSMGILLGAHWAYAVLGWGGYWGWDPVENASLLPWLTGTAFLHSVMMQEKRGMMKVWNVWLVFCTFLLCMLGTFLTRSGVGGPYFNRVDIPVGLLILFLTGVGPLLAWRKTSRESLKRNFGWPLLTGLLAGGVGFILGFRGFYPLASLILCFFVAATILLEFYRGSKVIRARSGASFAACAIDLTMRNTRRYGGYCIHMGMVFVFIGLAGTAFDRDVQKSMQVGDSMHIGPYTLVLQATDSKPEKNYTAQRMMVEVLRGNKPMMMLFPEKRNFITNKENGTMVAIYSTLKEDLYVVFAGIDPDTQVPVIHAYLNPLVKWIWFGGVTVVFGTLIALSPNRRSVLVLAPAQQPATAEPLPQGVVASPLLREGHD